MERSGHRVSWDNSVPDLKNFGIQMEKLTKLEEVVEQIDLLLKELSITGGLLYQQLEGPMKSLTSGRSPQALDLASLIIEPRDNHGALGEILLELELQLKEFSRLVQSLDPSSSPTPNDLLGELKQLQKEMEFWRQFQDTFKILLNRLKLISQEENLSSLGKMPLEDAWQEIQNMASVKTPS